MDRETLHLQGALAFMLGWNGVFLFVLIVMIGGCFTTGLDTWAHVGGLAIGFAFGSLRTNDF